MGGRRMKKEILVISMILLLLSTLQLYAYSIDDFIEDLLKYTSGSLSSKENEIIKKRMEIFIKQINVDDNLRDNLAIKISSLNSDQQFKIFNVLKIYLGDEQLIYLFSYNFPYYKNSLLNIEKTKLNDSFSGPRGTSDNSIIALKEGETSADQQTENEGDPKLNKENKKETDETIENDDTNDTNTPTESNASGQSSGANTGTNTGADPNSSSGTGTNSNTGANQPQGSNTNGSNSNSNGSSNPVTSANATKSNTQSSNPNNNPVNTQNNSQNDAKNTNSNNYSNKYLSNIKVPDLPELEKTYTQSELNIIYAEGYKLFYKSDFEGAFVKFWICFKESFNIENSAYYLALIYEKNKEIDNALTFYKISLEINTKKPDLDPKMVGFLYKKIGTLFINQKSYEQAIIYFKKGIEFYPTDNELYFYTGFCYYKLMDYEKAKEYFTKASKLGNLQANEYLKLLN